MPKAIAQALLAPCLAIACASAGSSPVETPIAAPPPVAKPAEPPAVVRWAELQHELARALTAAGASCGAVANAMKTFVSRHQGELPTTFKALAAWERDAPAREVERFYRGVFAAVEVRIDAGARCKDDSSTSEAFDRFFAAAGLDLR